jgi:hypothetical protein
VSDFEDIYNDGLFPEPPLDYIKVGDRVMLRTIWGEEKCRVEEMGCDREGWPMVTVTTTSGDRVTVSRSSLIATEQP